MHQECIGSVLRVHLEALGGQMSDSPVEANSTGASTVSVSSEGLLPQLVQHLRRNRRCCARNGPAESPKPNCSPR